MYAYIKGTLEEKTTDSIVIETAGIGYKIYVSEHTMSRLGEIGEKIKIYTHYHVREDNVSLYGFMTNEEELTKLNSNDYQKKVAEGIYQAILRAFEEGYQK